MVGGESRARCCIASVSMLEQFLHCVYPHYLHLPVAPGCIFADDGTVGPATPIGGGLACAPKAAVDGISAMCPAVSAGEGDCEARPELDVPCEGVLFLESGVGC